MQSEKDGIGIGIKTMREKNFPGSKRRQGRSEWLWRKDHASS